MRRRVCRSAARSARPQPEVFLNRSVCNILAWFYSDACDLVRKLCPLPGTPWRDAVADIDLLPEVRLAGAMPVRDRLAIYRDAVCRSLVSLSVDIPDGDRFTAYVRARPLGVLRMTEVQSKPQIVRRTPRLINADDERYLKGGMLLTGRGVVTQHGREAAL